MLDIKTRISWLMQRPTIIFLIVFLVVNLRVVGWFQPGYPIFGSDTKPPIFPDAYVTRSVYAWNEIDFGIPSVYIPRLLNPFQVMIYGFQQVGAGIYTSEMLSTYVIYVLVSVLVYFYVRNLLHGDSVPAFIASLFFTSNLYLLVDTFNSSISYIEIALTILPCLTIFSESLRRKSLRTMPFAGFLFLLTFATFPNYRAILICVIMIPITIIAIEGKRLLNKQVLKFLIIFSLSALIASIWVLTYVGLNWQSLITSSNQPSNPIPFLEFVNPHDVPRLITKWTFYADALGMPYVPYANVYFDNPALIVISYLPAVFAFSSLAFNFHRKRTLFFAILAIIFLVLTTGFTVYFNGLYNYFVDTVPLMKAFREQASWTVFVTLFYGILIGIFTSSLIKKIRKRILKLTAIAMIVAVMFVTVYPMFTGEATVNWLYPKAKGSYIPKYMTQAEKSLSSDGWTLLLPRRNMYIIFNFTGKGVLNAGNPYPLLYTKPLLYGNGTEYLKSPSVDLLDFAYGLILNGNKSTDKFFGVLGIKYLLVEDTLVFGKLSNVGSLAEYELVQSWEYASLYKNSISLQKVYCADTVLHSDTVEEMYEKIANLGEIKNTCFTRNKVLGESNFVIPKEFSYTEKSPIEYKADATADHPFVFVLLENFDPGWRIYINGAIVSEENHVKVNGYANGWVLNATGNLSIQVEYEKQNVLEQAVIISIALSLLTTFVLWRKQLFPNIIKKHLAKIAQRVRERVQQKLP